MTGPHVPLWPAWMDEDRATGRLFREAEERNLVTYRLQCAAITNGCMAFIAFEGERNIDMYHLDPLAWADRRAGRMLELNGWHLDHGRWVCGAHERTAPCEHQDPAGRLRPGYAGG